MSHDGRMQESPTLGDAHQPRLTLQDFLDRLDTTTQQFADLVATGDLDAPVPSCPDWAFKDLVAHLGEVHQWATHAIVAGNPHAQPTPVPSSDQSALAAWYRSAAATLSSTLRNTDPQAPAWTFGPKPRTASFWFRRQAHESTVHLWDAATSQRADTSVDTTLALDGIDELITVFFPRQVRLGRTPPLDHTLALETAGPKGLQRWVLAGDGTTPASNPDAPAEATITGPAERLYLLLWGRTTRDDPQLMVTGDETAAHLVLNANLAP